MCEKLELLWLPPLVLDSCKKKNKIVGVEKNGEACDDMHQSDYSDTGIWLLWNSVGNSNYICMENFYKFSGTK